MKLAKKVTKDVWMKVADINRESGIIWSDANNQVWKPLHRMVMAEVWLNVMNECEETEDIII